MKEYSEYIVKLQYGMEIGYREELVRCEDCIFGNDFDIDNHPYVGYQCEKGYGSHTGDWFCGDGKRKD